MAAVNRRLFLALSSRCFGNIYGNLKLGKCRSREFVLIQKTSWLAGSLACRPAYSDATATVHFRFRCCQFCSARGQAIHLASGGRKCTSESGLFCVAKLAESRAIMMSVAQLGLFARPAPLLPLFSLAKFSGPNSGRSISSSSGSGGGHLHRRLARFSGRAPLDCCGCDPRRLSCSSRPAGPGCFWPSG